LPGRLEQNTAKKFFCDWTNCKIVGQSFFHDKSLLKKSFAIPVAHGYGRYEISEKKYNELEKNGQVFLRYDGVNPNGSFKNIAGVCNKDGTIFGMMPHPERTPDGKYFMKAIENYVTKTNNH
jgi:phosphoribosylformylglycinamidine (FGAM) synthase-like amidotransferase family enzyme